MEREEREPFQVPVRGCASSLLSPSLRGAAAGGPGQRRVTWLSSPAAPTATAIERGQPAAPPAVFQKRKEKKNKTHLFTNL